MKWMRKEQVKHEETKGQESYDNDIQKEQVKEHKKKEESKRQNKYHQQINEPQPPKKQYYQENFIHKEEKQYKVTDYHLNEEPLKSQTSEQSANYLLGFSYKEDDSYTQPSNYGSSYY